MREIKAGRDFRLNARGCGAMAVGRIYLAFNATKP